MVPAAEVDGDERRAGLDQPPGQQGALAPVVPAVAVAQARFFLVDVEGVARRRAGDELVRFAAGSGPSPPCRRRCCRGRGGPCRSGRAGVRRSSSRSSVRPGRQVQVVDAEVRAFGSPPVWNGLCCDAEHVAAEIAGIQADAGGVGHGRRSRACRGWRGPTSRVTMAPMPGNRCVVVGAADAHVLGRQHAMAAGEVVAGVVVQRADDRELVGDLGLLGEQLGDVEAGHAGADRLPDAAILGRGVRLQVVHVHVAGAAVEPDQDDGGVLFRRPRAIPSRAQRVAAGRRWPCRRRRVGGSSAGDMPSQ